MKSIVVSVSMALAVLILPLAPAGAEAAEPSLAESMRGIRDRLAAILPLAVGTDPLTDAEREEFAVRLGELLAAAEAIEGHGMRRDPGFRYLSGSLVDDLRGVERSFQRNNEDSARYFLIAATSNCVACHSRLPSGTAPSLLPAFSEHIDSERASPHEKAQLLVATRQFDAALGVWESAIADPEMTPSELDIGGYLLDYLTVAIRVEHDLARPIPHLTALAARPATPRYLRNYLEHWASELERLAAMKPPKDRLAAARTLGEQASSGSGRERMVADLQASAWLLQLIESGDVPDPVLAEAFYQLGVLEWRNVEGYWVPQTDAHLEAAVRLDPDGPYAWKAYDLLEEYLITGYAGIQGSELPPDLHARLAALIDLLYDANPDRARAATRNAESSAAEGD